MALDPRLLVEDPRDPGRSRRRMGTGRRQERIYGAVQYVTGQHIRIMERAATNAMSEVANSAKEEIRSQVKAAFKGAPPGAKGKGQNFVKSFRAHTWPSQGNSMTPAGMIGGEADYAHAFETGATVTASQSTYLAIPFRKAERAGYARGRTQAGRHGKESQVGKARKDFGGLQMVPAKSGYLLAASAELARHQGLKTNKRERKQGFVPLFYLTRSVKLPQKLDFHTVTARWHEELPRAFAQWLKEEKARG